MDQVLRYRVELDPSSMMSQLQAIEASAGGHIATAIRPVEMAIGTTFQSGVQALATAQTQAMRAQMMLPQSSGFFAPNLFSAGMPDDGFTTNAARALGITPHRDYRYSPMENQYLYGQSAGATARDSVMSASRATMEFAGGFVGSGVGMGVGASLGAGIGGALLGGPGRIAGLVAGGLGGIFGGMEVGEMAYGPFGGYGIGALAGGLAAGRFGAALGGPAGAIAGLGAQALIEQVGARNRIGSLIEQVGSTSVPFPFSSSPLGTGFTPGQQGKAADQILSMAARDFRFDMDDYQSIIASGARSGAYDGANTVDKFVKTTKDLVASVKDIQSKLRMTLDEALPTMELFNAQGIGSVDRVRQLTTQIRSTAMVTGISPQDLIASGQMGTALTRGVLFNDTGMEMGIQARGMSRFIRQVGGVRDAFGNDVTNQTIAAAGGEEQISSDLMRMSSGFMRSGAGGMLLQAAYDPRTRRVNTDLLEEFSSGQRSVEEMQLLAGKNMASFDNQMRFAADRARISQDVGTDRWNQLMFQSYKEEAKRSPWGGMPEGLQFIFEQRAQGAGVSQMSARAGLAALQNQESMAAFQDLAETTRGVLASEDEKMREFGLRGYWRKAGRYLGGMAADAGAYVAQNLWDPIVDKASRFYNQDVLGIPQGVDVRIGPEDLRALSGYEAPSSAAQEISDLRTNPRGFLPRIFGPPLGTFTPRESLQMRIGDVGTAGYGDLAEVSTDSLVPGRGGFIPIRDLGGGLTLATQGTLDQIYRGEQENQRLSGVLSQGQASWYQTVDQLTPRSRYGEVNAAVEMVGEDPFSQYVRSKQWAHGAERPSLTSMVYAVGQEQLGYTKEQLDSDVELRSEIARRAGRELTSEELAQMGQSIPLDFKPEELPQRLAEAQSMISEKFLDGYEINQENQGAAFSMAKGAADFLREGQTVGTGEGARKSLRNRLLRDAGLGTVGADGEFRYYPQTTNAQKVEGWEMATRMANRTLDHHQRIQEGKVSPADAANVLSALETAPGWLHASQQQEVFKGLTGHLGRMSSLSKGPASPVMDEIRRLAVPGKKDQLFNFISNLDQKEAVIAHFEGKGLDRAGAEEAFEAMQKDKGLSRVLKLEEDVETTVANWGTGVEDSEVAGLYRKLTPIAGDKNAKYMAADLASMARAGKSGQEMSKAARDLVMTAVGARASGKGSSEATTTGSDGQAESTLKAVQETAAQLGEVLRQVVDAIPKG